MVPPRQTNTLGGRTLALNRRPWPQRIYRLLAYLLLAPLLGWLWWRGRREPAYRQRWRERLGFIDPHPSAQSGLWLHAASVGEVQAARPLIEALLQHWPAHSLVVTTQTPTGAETLRQHWGERLTHFYCPFDTLDSTSRFLERLQPRLLLVLEREIWPEMLYQCQQRAIPVTLINARLGTNTERLYQRYARLMQPIWSQWALCACADEHSLAALARLGVPKTRLLLTGNLKFDQTAASGHMHLPVGLDTRLLFVAGSTHADDEEALLAAWPDFAQRHPTALLVLVPRHPQRFDAVAQQLQQVELPFERRSQHLTIIPSDTQVLLIDTMGELSHWYAHATWCFIGGTLANIGGHNALEAMLWGRAVLFGPHTQHFTSLYHDIEQAGAGQRIGSGDELFATASAWLAESSLARRGQAAQQFVAQHQGASARTVSALQALPCPLPPVQLPNVTTLDTATSTIWHDANTLGTWRNADFEVAVTQANQTLATGSGRGQALQVAVHGEEVVLRHYRRGGWVARLSADRYAPTPVSNSRAMRELALLRLLHAWQLPVPKPVAARCTAQGWRGYTADIMVALIPNSRNVAQLLDEQALPLQAWVALGRAIAQLHQAQVFHADLNCHNLLLDEQGRAWVVDFDKCRIQEGEAWKAKNLDRLLRSFRKEAQRRRTFYWREDHWYHLLAGYQER